MRLEIQYLAPGDLTPNSWNPNTVTEEHQEKLKESIKRFDQFKPILVRQLPDSIEILGGHHRCKAAFDLGIKEVPVINLGIVDDNRAKEISLVDNERYGTDDHLALTELMQSLDTASDLPDFMPISVEELFTLTSSIELDLDDLEIDDDDDEEEDDHVTTASPKTHQIMRFKVPIENADLVKETIQSLIDALGYEDSDAMINAGDALVSIIKGVADDGK